MPHPELAKPTLIPNLVEPAQIDRIRAYVESIYAGRDIGEPSSFYDDPEVNRALKWGGLSVAHLQKHGFAGIDFLIQPIRETIRRRWNGVFLDKYSVFRRIDPDNSTTIHWHCDAEGTNTAHEFSQVWNCWLPLSPVGACNGRPTLEILEGTDRLMLQIPRQWGNDAERSNDWIETCARSFVTSTIRPSMQPGDALLFNHWLLHRTEPLERMKDGPHRKMLGPRIGFECRFTLATKTRTRNYYYASERWIANKLPTPIRQIAGQIKKRLLSP